eukprot:13477455-Alexandrium_andersonii.AAC.1
MEGALGHRKGVAMEGYLGTERVSVYKIISGPESGGYGKLSWAPKGAVMEGCLGPRTGRL